jgi:hypothetical protein
MSAQTVEAQRQTQEDLAKLALPEIMTALALLDPENVDGSLDLVKTAILAVVQFYGHAAAAEALEFYQSERAAAGVATPLPAAVVEPITSLMVDDALTEALKPIGAFHPDPQLALDRLSEAAEQLVFEQYRRQMSSATEVDDQATGWARVPNADACSFCLMLALRGPVYTSKAAAGPNRRSRRNPNRPDEAFLGAGAAKVHDNCRCGVEPVFGGAFEPSARVREAQKVWDEVTKGRSGNDARNAFRQAIEGRPVTGTKGKPTKSGPPAEILGSNMTEAQIRHQIDLLNTLKDSDYRRRRLRELRALLAK